MIRLSLKCLPAYAHQSVNFTIWLGLGCLQPTLTQGERFYQGAEAFRIFTWELVHPGFQYNQSYDKALLETNFFFYMQPFKH